jgi:hypothetical protein
MLKFLLWFMNLLFKSEEINGGNRCPTYLFRWTLVRTPWFQVYLHRFVGEDWSRDMHDHPKRFLSVGLAGGYIEHTPNGQRDYDAPWIRSFPAKHIHRLTLGKNKECWTLIIVGHASRPWGFWHLGRWIPWKEYVLGASKGIADKMASCGGG